MYHSRQRQESSESGFSTRFASPASPKRVEADEASQVGDDRKIVKLSYIANARMPTEKAHGIQLAKMGEAFIEQGADVELIVPDRKTDAMTLREYYGLRVDVPLTKLKVIDWYANGRIGFFIGSLTFAISYFFYVRKHRRGGNLVYTTDIDQFSFFLIPFLGMPYVVEIHDAKPKGLLFGILFRRAKGIVVINNIIRKKLMERFEIAEEKIIVHPNGIDLSSYRNLPLQQAARVLLGIPPHIWVLLYVGRFYSWKGLAVIAKSAPLLEREVVSYLVGGTFDEFTQSTGIYPIPSGISCVGDRAFKEIPNWLAAADCLLLLGTRENEYSFLHTSPMKIFEYMASGKPIIASRTPANEEIVSADEVFFYEPDNAKELAAKIQYVRSHSSEAQEKAEKASRKVEAYTWEKRVKSILGFIESRIMNYRETK